MIKIKMNITKIVSAILLIGGLLTFLWYQDISTKSLLQADSLSTSPDYFITNIKARKFDEQGNLVETLNANKALHYKEGSRTLLDTPLIERRTLSGSWNANSEKGVIHDGSNDILLTKNAKAMKTLTNSKEITLIADNIHYIDKQKVLITSGGATLLSPQGETVAEKITTYINSENIIMTGPIRGNYEQTH